MSHKKRTVEKISCRYCSHAKSEITLTTSFVFPANFLPDQPPRLLSRECSHYFDCNLVNKKACTYAVRTLIPAKPE